MIAALAMIAALSFAPPLDRPLRYETTERRARADGSTRGATLTQEIAFAADGDGYVMTIRTVGYRAAASPAENATFDAMMKPMVGAVLRVRLSRGGVPERVIDGDAAWSAMLAALRTEIAAHRPDDPALAPARAMLASLDATPVAARDAHLIAAADDVLATHLPPLAVGGRIDGALGTISRDADTGDDAQYRQRQTQVAGGRTLESDTSIAVSRATGLIAHSLRRVAVDTTAGARPVSESETWFRP